MSQLSNACLIAGLALAGAASAQEPPAGDDPYAWLEKVDDKASLDWVKARNAKAEAEIATTAEFKSLEAEILAILDSDAKIPGVEKIGDYYYNFWKDKQHERGLWRRTTLAEYRKPKPRGRPCSTSTRSTRPRTKKWVWHGADCLRPAYERCLIALSPGGSDADVTREFDLTTKQFVKDGFFRPEAKGGLSWIDRDTVYVYTDFGPGSDDQLRLSEHRQGMEARHADVGGEARVRRQAGRHVHRRRPRPHARLRARLRQPHHRLLQRRAVPARQGRQLAKVDAPNSAQKGVHKDWLVLELREPVDGRRQDLQAGSLIATDFDDFMAGKRDFTRAVRADRQVLAGRLHVDEGPSGPERHGGRQEPPAC
jgi:prolyl oligopeptidase